MDILNNICVTGITGVCTVNYDRRVEKNMASRAWHGISLAVDGEIVYYHKGQEFVSDRNHLILLPMGASYRFACTKPGHFTLVNFNCPDGCLTGDFARIPIENPDVYLKYHKSLEEIFAFKGTRNFASTMAAFYKMLATTAGDGENPSFSKSNNPVLKPCLDYMQKNLSNPELTNRIIADKGGISEVYFTKLFRQSFGISPKQYIQQARMNLAGQLLAGGDASVSQIAEMCGYASLFHFCRAFRQKTGYTPGEYRKKFKNIDM